MIQEKADIAPTAWHMHLLRNMSDCRGSRLQLAKSELYALMLKAAHASPDVAVTIWTNSYSAERYFQPWLDELGVTKLPVRFKIQIFETGLPINRLQRKSLVLQDECEDIKFLIEKKGMDDLNEIWAQEVSKKIYQYLDSIEDLASDTLPAWLYVHQQTQDDVIVAQFQ